MPQPAVASSRITFAVAWLGTLAFFGSLAFFAFSYAFRFARIGPGRPAFDGATLGALAINVALFSAFALHHSLFARTPIRAWVARHVPNNLERSFYVWVASALFAAVCVAWRPLPGVAWSASGVWYWLLTATQLAGVWLTLRGAAVLDVRELSGVRQALMSAPATPRDAELDAHTESGPSPFRTAGPYGWVRHPIYSGWFLIVLAATPMTTTRLSFAVISCLYLIVAIPFEERTLASTSGGHYERYTRQVRWKLVPGLY